MRCARPWARDFRRSDETQTRQWSLLHPTSLPGGRLGEEAYRFVDWLAAAGQSWWQVLPLGPPDTDGSPYNAASAFAGSPALLAEPRARVTAADVEDFVARHPFWTGDWAAFAGEDALADQVRFEREWSALRALRARARRPHLRRHADLRRCGQRRARRASRAVRARRGRGRAAGQLLGDRPALGQSALRLARAPRDGLPLVDRALPAHVRARRHARIDHFRGFVAYWAIPERHKTAQHGRWRARSRRRARSTRSRAALGDLPLVAEDLGVITPAVVRLRKRARAARGWSSCSGRSAARAKPARARRTTRSSPSSTRRRTTPTRRAAGSTSLPKREREATPLDPREPHWSLIELAHASRAALSIVPAQDVLGLGSAARMNTPGHVDGQLALAARAAGSSPTSSPRDCGNRRRAAIGSPRERPHVAGATRRRLRRAARADGGARRGAARADRAGRAGRRRAGARAPPRARQADRARAHRPADRPGLGVPRAERARRVGYLRRDRPRARASSPGSASSRAGSA